MTRKKRFFPYVLLGLFLAFLFHRAGVLYTLAPKPKGSSQIFSQYVYVIEHYMDAPYVYLQLELMPLVCVLVGFIVALMLYFRISYDGTYRHGEEAGSARFATVKELLRFRDVEPTNNMIFSKNAQMGLYNKRLAYENQLNKNVTVLGLPGDGKTYTYVKPNLMQMNSSYVVTDPKGLLVHEVGHLLEEHGYKIKVFDLVTLSNSDTFNPFHYMKSELDIDRISEAIVDGTKKSDNQGENFWVQANLLLTRALIGYLWFDSQVRDYTANLSMVSDLLRNLQRTNEKEPSPVEKLFLKLEEAIPGNYACRQWELFNANFQAETRTSVLAVMSAQYSVFDHDQVTNLIATDSMEIETWNTQKTAVFIAIPETNKAFNFLASTMFAVMFDVLAHGADEILQGKRPGFSAKDLIHIQLLIDEFANIGRIPNLNEVLASVRSREISLKIILQALNQIKAIYKDDWKTILNNCATILYLGTNDEDTMKYFSMRAGKQTIKQMDYSESRGQHKSGSTSYRNQQRDLMTPDEVARIGVDEALVFISKQNVFKDKKASVADHPMKDYLANSPDDDTWYTYKRYMSDIEEFLESIADDEVVELSEDAATDFLEQLELHQEALEGDVRDDLFDYTAEMDVESSPETPIPNRDVQIRRK